VNTPLLLALPWILYGFYIVIRHRTPYKLPPAPDGGERASNADADALPNVTVIVPARNEASNIVRCLTALAASDYPDFDVVVVDDRSEDDTAVLAGEVARGSSRSITVIEGKPLPEGWFGKPWACAQGAEAATGDLLLFTDADTIHDPRLLPRAVAAFRDDGADALSVVGRQIMGTFWERVIQPQIFFLLGSRFPNLRKLYGETLSDPARWREAIANGQFILINRAVYEDLGGHRTVRGEVVEDLRFAQHIVRSGKRLALRDAMDVLATRMYRSLGELVEGWTKNLWTGSRQSVEGTIQEALILPAGVVALVVLWIVPPVTLALALAGVVGTDALLWAGITTFCGWAIWTAAAIFFKAPWYYGFTFPLGAAMTVFLLVRSALKGSHIEWKGRRYGPA
jgi:chlorobactene glucosyltransferase